MHRYKVLAADPHSAVVALVDSDGRCHVGRAMATAPSPGVELIGDSPAVGLQSLRIATGDDLYPVSLALLDCDPVVAAEVARGT